MNPQSPLHGVHHTARPTWKLAETVRFYRDVLGLPLVHAITARGWGPADHADFVHFFFDSGHGSHIAFFFYIGTEEPDFLKPREDYRYRATHTAWSVPTRQALLDLRRRLEDAGVPHASLERGLYRRPQSQGCRIPPLAAQSPSALWCDQPRACARV